MSAYINQGQGVMWKRLRSHRSTVPGSLGPLELLESLKGEECMTIGPSRGSAEWQVTTVSSNINLPFSELTPRRRLKPPTLLRCYAATMEAKGIIVQQAVSA